MLKPVTDAPGSLGPCDDGVSKAPVGSNTKTGRYGPFVSGTALDADRFAVGALPLGVSYVNRPYLPPDVACR